jgi:hypothetical protein
MQHMAKSSRTRWISAEQVYHPQLYDERFRSSQVHMFILATQRMHSYIVIRSKNKTIT